MRKRKTVLGTLLARHALALASHRPVKPVRRNLVTGPKGGVAMLEEVPR